MTLLGRFGVGVAIAASLLTLGVAPPASALTNATVDRIDCTVSLDDPHGSHHVSGTISAQGRVTCTKTVSEIYIKTSIQNVGNTTWASQTFDKFNVKTGSSVGAKACSEGPATFRSFADVVVHFPPGYSPATDTENHSSPNTHVACGAPFAAAAEPGTTEWTITAVRE